MRVIGYSNEVTQTEPSPTAISPPGPGMPASIVATTLFVFTSTREIGPALVHDSPELARLARSHGAQPYVDRFPMALVGVVYRYRFGTPEGYANFFDDVATSCHVEIYVNFETGGLLGRDLTCLNNLP